MNTVENLTSEEQAIKDRLQQIAFEKQNAIEAERKEKLDHIDQLVMRAKAYRNQALMTTSDSDKDRLYLSADECDSTANELRLELGLVSEEQLKAINTEQRENERQSIYRKINGLLFKSVGAIVLFLVSDFISGKSDAGFFSFTLKVLSTISWGVAGIFGGSYLAVSTLLAVTGQYAFTELKQDFNRTSPAVRLSLLAGLLFSFLLFLSTIICNAS